MLYLELFYAPLKWVLRFGKKIKKKNEIFVLNSAEAATTNAREKTNKTKK